MGSWPLHKTVLRGLLALFTNTLLNLMDAITYGALIFPISAPFFRDAAVDGITLYLLSTAVSQAVMAAMSSFQMGVAASAMVENIPFFNAICFQVLREVPSRDKTTVASTVVAALALGTLLSAAAFWGLARFRIDTWLKKIPRALLMGSLGGIGAFLLSTGIELVLKAPLTVFSLPRLREPTVLAQVVLGIVPALAVVWVEQVAAMAFLPAFTAVFLFVAFYVVVYLLGVPLAGLRDRGWLVDVSSIGSKSPWDICRRLRWSSIQFPTVLRQLPTLVGMTVFSLLHVPINVPSFARTSGQPVSLRRELYTHAASNAASTFLGSLPVYLVYTNSVLFMKAGARTRAVGILLAAATLGLVWVGVPLVGYIPMVAVLFLVLYMALDLLREALVSTWRPGLSGEYAVIVVTIVAMMGVGFVSGLAAGGAMSLLYAVRLCSRPRPRGLAAKRLVYAPHQMAFLDATRDSCTAFCIEGPLFFANVHGFLRDLERAIHSPTLSHIILNLDGCTGYDLNFVEGLLAVLDEWPSHPVTVACSGLRGRIVGILERQFTVRVGRLRLFENANEAREWMDRERLETLDRRAVWSGGLAGSGGEGGDGAVVVPVESRAAVDQAIVEAARIKDGIGAAGKGLFRDCGVQTRARPDRIAEPGLVFVESGRLASQDAVYGPGTFVLVLHPLHVVSDAASVRHLSVSGLLAGLDGLSPADHALLLSAVRQ